MLVQRSWAKSKQNDPSRPFNLTANLDSAPRSVSTARRSERPKNAERSSIVVLPSESFKLKPEKSEFVVPHIESSVAESRSGLRSREKNFRTDLEKMRLESDGRLKTALKRAALRHQRLMEEAEMSKKKKPAGLAPKALRKGEQKVESPLILPQVSASSSKVNRPDPTAKKSKSPSGSIAKRPKVVPKSPKITPKLNSKVFEEGTNSRSVTPSRQLAVSQSPSQPVTKLQTQSHAEKDSIDKSLVKKIMTQKAPEKKISLTNATMNYQSIDPPTKERKEIVQDLIDHLDAKLVPVLQSVEQRWHKTAEHIDSKLMHLPSSQNSIEDKGAGVEQQIQTEPEEMEVIVIPKSSVVLTEPSRQSEIIQIAFEDPIIISKEVATNKIATNREKPLKTFLVLPSNVTSSIQEPKNIRKKFSETYFGYTDAFHPSMALES
jgi:hypothetical protein